MSREAWLSGEWAWLAVGFGGWLWGSFLNQLVDRLSSSPSAPLSTRWRGGAARDFAARGAAPGVRTSLDLLHPLRSICLVCGAPIPWYDNLPIVSYLVLRGRCRRCGAPIGRRTLVLEAATPLIGLAIYAGWGWSAWTAAAWLAASWSAVALALRAERRAAPRGFRLAGVAIAAAAAWAAWLRWGTGA